MSKKKICFCFIVLLLTLFTFKDIVFGNDDIEILNFQEINAKIFKLEEELKLNSEVIEETKKIMEEIESHIESTNITIEKYDEEIYLIDEKIRSNLEVLEKLDDETKIVLTRLEEEQDKLEKNKKIYSKQVKFLYVNGISGQLKLIFSAENWDSFVSYITFIKNLNNYNEELFIELSKSIDIINHENAVLEKNKNTIRIIKGKNISRKKTIEEKKKEQIIVIRKISENKKKYKLLLEEYGIKSTLKEKMIAEIRIKLEYMKEKKKSLGMKEIIGEKLVEYASKFIGDPYKWAGTRPYDGTGGSGFDCSGFVQYCFRKFGVEVGRNTYMQVVDDDGVRVERKGLKIGDVVFFGSKSAPHHVGIYVGDNAYIHSPQTGDVIKISPMTRSDFVIGRRFLNN